ncbi:hypothetical protein OIU74_026419 [Salix koriyanagi]|uniref:Uncharacterized protein n=1 Tax=Salix koriyanagi TaxID=2511006 RepID=A0A9Q1A3S4_9ROSI|nr:hypothetical protein OIU74_026419 [Salix koriyanagi]
MGFNYWLGSQSLHYWTVWFAWLPPSPVLCIIHCFRQTYILSWNIFGFLNLSFTWFCCTHVNFLQLISHVL